MEGIKRMDCNGWIYDDDPVDEHGNVVSKTKSEYPYTYDGFVTFRGGENKEANCAVYTDRLYREDHKKHDELVKKHFGDTGQYWSSRNSEKIEAFLRDWTGDKELKLILVMEYCNVSSGYPLWRFDFKWSK